MIDPFDRNGIAPSHIYTNHTAPHSFSISTEESIALSHSERAHQRRWRRVQGLVSRLAMVMMYWQELHTYCRACGGLHGLGRNRLHHLTST